MPPKKNLSRGSLSNWCDVDADADKTICKQYVDSHPMGGGGGRHNKNVSSYSVYTTISMNRSHLFLAVNTSR